MNAIEQYHERHVKDRRVQVLSAMLANLLPDEGSVLDIGSGDGAIAAEIMRRKPDLHIEGIDTLVREGTLIPMKAFDGVHIEAPDNSVDWCLLVDVVHHANEPEALLREAARVCRNGIVLKDHLRDGMMARETLRFMDRTHNARYGVNMPYCYWSTREWREVISALGLSVEAWYDRLQLYPWWANWVFGRGLHVLTRLRCK